ncbi:MAG: hypothetical protein Q7T93_17785 [Methylobacterium sp.]|uniref:hypothetical protein n=1 Tax=Methylobacterium sp. TaxID=409 RepID=UPI002718DB0C|nr:hypothetical protein [Methylobacterium sp.]MDO9428666.1 hypothetical protein [Methylobacterium sp.]
MLISRECLRALDGKLFMRRHIAKTGETIAGTPVWTRLEIDVLRAAYPDRASACSALHRRTWAAIRQKARHLGLVRRRRVWIHDDARLLRSLYPSGIPIDELLGRFAGKTKRQIWHKAAHLRLRRSRRPPRITGQPLVDSVRQRAFTLGYSMTDLDAWTGAKRYFGDARYVDWHALQRAIDLMGGRVVVHWNSATESVGCRHGGAAP